MNQQQNISSIIANSNKHFRAETQQKIRQDLLHPCPACESCTRERIPDRCTCFRECPYYRCWLERVWRRVITPLQRKTSSQRHPLHKD